MSDDEVVDPKKILAAEATQTVCKGALQAYKVLPNFLRRLSSLEPPQLIFMFHLFPGLR
jgi:hypothetical protein